MSRTHINCIVNGEPIDFLAADATSLLDALRDELGLIGTKEGCGTGDCGSCSVLVDGKLNCSCLILAPEVEGREILTVEGIADGDQLHPLQQTFLEGAALQCGICTPGFLVAAKALLDANPDPTETEIRYGPRRQPLPVHRLRQNRARGTRSRRETELDQQAGSVR